MRAARGLNPVSLLLRAGDVHPNPGPSLRIAQFNTRGFPAGKRDSLLHKAKVHDLDVILLQELRVSEDQAYRLALPGFHCFAICRNAKTGGVAVLVREALDCALQSESLSEIVDHITVRVRVGDTIAYFTSAYFPRGAKVSSAALSRLSQGEWRTHVIGTDANCHHHAWDVKAQPNPGGKRIVDFCVDEAYTIVNTGDMTRLGLNDDSLSAPDITLARGCIARRWQANPDPDSDHYFITFDFVIGDDEPLGNRVSQRSYYSWGKADWNVFQRLVADEIKKFPKKGNPDQQAKFFSRCIAKATAKAVPYGVAPITHIWSAALEDATSKCEKLLRQIINGSTPALRRQALAAIRERRRLLDTDCRDKWGKVCAKMNPASSSTWKTLQNIITARPTPTNLVVEGGRAVPLKRVANHLVSFFKTKATRHPHAMVPEAPPCPPSQMCAISRQELDGALKCVSCHTACGPDEVYNEALVQLPRVARTALLRMFNRSLSKGIVPREWKSGTIFPLLKPGKPVGPVESYRPVTLTSTVAKLMERIIHGRIKHLVTSDNQAGFRASRSTTDALMWLRSHVQPTSASKTPLTSAVFVDFSRAFDSVDHNLLLLRLQKLNVDPYLVRWILSFLTDRRVRVRLGKRHYSRTRIFTCGVPQGTVLGPLLFNIFMEDLSAELSKIPGAHHYFYADDLTIVASGEDRELVLNQALAMLKQWSETHFMGVNVAKTKACHFRSRNNFPVLKYGDTVLAIEDTPKLLGLTFNSHRGFGHHTQSMKKKSVKTLLRLSAVSNTVLGASRDTIRCFHLALVSSSLLYACPVWFSIVSDTDLATMDSIQARGARLACGLPATTNTYDSLLEADLPSVSEKAEYLTYKSFLMSSLHGGSRAANVSFCHPPRGKIGKRHTEIKEEYGPVEPLTDAPTLHHRIFIRPKTLEAVTKEMDDAVKKRASDGALAHRCSADVELWTDGSYDEEKSSVSGAALIFTKGKESYQTVAVCGKGRSSFRSECIALHAGLCRITTDKILSPGQRLKIVSDSQSLLTALKSHTACATTSTFADCVRMLNDLAKRRVKILVQFVFGHCGVSRNELADAAANAAHGCGTRYALWYRDALSIARQKIANEASNKLEARSTHRRRVVGLQPTKSHHLTGDRERDTIAAQLRVNWSHHIGDLHRKNNPSVAMCCRWDSGPPAPPSLHTTEEARRKRGRTRDPVKCPECLIMTLASRTSGVNHLVSTHGYTRKDALRLLRNEPPASPRNLTVRQKCPYCPRDFSSVASANRHVVEVHRSEARIKRARCPAQPVTPVAPETLNCPECNFVAKSKGGLTAHLLRTHEIDRRLPRNHRPSDCEESAEHVLFYCPGLADLRAKHGIQPPGAPRDPQDKKQAWFDPRESAFVVEALHLLPSLGYETSLPSAGSQTATPNCQSRSAQPSVSSSLRETDNEARHLGRASNTSPSIAGSQAASPNCHPRSAPSSVTSTLKQNDKETRQLACAER